MRVKVITEKYDSTCFYHKVWEYGASVCSCTDFNDDDTFRRGVCLYLRFWKYSVEVMLLGKVRKEEEERF